MIEATDTSRDAREIVARVRELADSLAQRRAERQQRRELDPADFEMVRQAGFHLACLPEEVGGLWQNRSVSTRLICDLLRILAGADSSLALVCAMHPAVLMATRGLDRCEAPEPYNAVWEIQRAWAFQTVREGAWWGTIQS